VGASEDLGGLDRVAANERHFLAGTRSRARGAPFVLQCECTLLLCDQRIELTPEQYEPVRSSAARYAVYPHDAHVDQGVDEVVERQISHWVVERQSSVEVLDFFAGASNPLVSEHTARVTELRIATPVSEEDPESSA
jgi:hypothetical protein